MFNKIAPLVAILALMPLIAFAQLSPTQGPETGVGTGKVLGDRSSGTFTKEFLSPVNPNLVGDDVSEGRWWDPVVDFSGATVYYFDPEADAGGDGSFTDPFQDLATEVAAGTISQYNASYTEVVDGPVNNGDLCVLLNGDHGDVTFDAYHWEDFLGIYCYSPNAVVENFTFKEVEGLYFEGNMKYKMRQSYDTPGSSYNDVPRQVNIIDSDGGVLSSRIIFNNCRFGVAPYATSKEWENIAAWNTNAVDGVRLAGVERIRFENCVWETTADNINGYGNGVVEVINCSFQGFCGDGFTHGDLDSLSFEDNLVYDVYKTNDDHPDLLQLWGANETVHIERNEFVWTTEFGRVGMRYIGSNVHQGVFLATIDAGGGVSGGVHDNVFIRNNKIVTNSWTGIHVWQGRNVQITNNTMVTVYTDSDSTEYYFNYDGYPIIKVHDGLEDTSENIFIANNICGDISLEDNNCKVTAHNNLEYGKDFSAAEFVSWTAGGDPSQFDLHLTIDSPALDTGTPAYAPVDDYASNGRPRNNLFDIGAHEYTDANFLLPTYNDSLRVFSEQRCATLRNGASSGTDYSGNRYVIANDFQAWPLGTLGWVGLQYFGIDDALSADSVVDSARAYLTACWANWDIATTDTLYCVPVYASGYDWLDEEATCTDEMNMVANDLWPEDVDDWYLSDLTGHWTYGTPITGTSTTADGTQFVVELTDTFRNAPTKLDSWRGIAWILKTNSSSDEVGWYSHNDVTSSYHPKLRLKWREPDGGEVASSDGDLTDGEIFTLVGSGFGGPYNDKPNDVGPDMWDDFDDGTLGAKINPTRSDETDGNWFNEVETDDSDVAYNTYGAEFSNNYSRYTGDQSACLFFEGDDAADGVGNANQEFGIVNQSITEVYTRWYQYYDPEGGNYSPSRNYKIFALRGADPGGWDPPALRIDTYPNSTAKKWHMYTEVCDNETGDDEPFERWSDHPGGTPGGTYQNWTLVEVYFDVGTVGSADGTYQVWVNNDLYMSCTDSTMMDWYHGGSGPCPFTVLYICGYHAGDNLVSGYSYYPKAQTYIDDVYISFTPQRIVLADDSNPANWTVTEIQEPTYWASDGDSLQFRVHQGQFEDGETVWAFIYNENGSRSNGHELTFSSDGGGGDTTPPTTSGTFVEAAFNTLDVDDIEIDVSIDASENVRSWVQWKIGWDGTWAPADTSGGWLPATPTADEFTISLATSTSTADADGDTFYTRYKLCDVTDPQNESDWTTAEKTVFTQPSGGGESVLYIFSPDSEAYSISGSGPYTKTGIDSSEWEGEIHEMDLDKINIAEATLEYNDQDEVMSSNDGSIELRFYTTGLPVSNLDKFGMIHVDFDSIPNTYTVEKAIFHFRITSQSWGAGSTLEMALIDQASYDNWWTELTSGASTYGDACWNYYDSEGTNTWTTVPGAASSWSVLTSETVCDTTTTSEVASGSWGHLMITNLVAAIVEDDNQNSGFGLFGEAHADENPEHMYIYSGRGGTASYRWYIEVYCTKP